MKKPMNVRQSNILDWLSEEEDDFLIGKTPLEFPEAWEDEE